MFSRRNIGMVWIWNQPREWYGKWLDISGTGAWVFKRPAVRKRTFNPLDYRSEINIQYTTNSYDINIVYIWICFNFIIEPNPLWPSEGAIRFQNVSLHYGDVVTSSNEASKKVLKDISFSIESKEKVNMLLFYMVHHQHIYRLIKLNIFWRLALLGALEQENLLWLLPYFALPNQLEL